MKIALIRHGQTAANLRKAFIGRLDQPLCLSGQNQITQMVQGGCFPTAEQVYTSPLQRCIQTAKIIYPDADSILIDDLRERNFGKYDGMDYAEITALPGNAQWGIDIASMQFPEGESWSDFSDRCAKSFSDIIEKHTIDCEQIAVVCHGGTIMSIMEHFVSRDGDYYQWMCENGCGYLVTVNQARQLLLDRRIGS